MSALSEKHFELAEAHGIPRSRIVSASNRDEFCAAAVRHRETNAFNESTLGLSIQADDIPGGADVWIILRCPVPLEEHAKTFSRLEARGLSPSPNYLDTSKPQWLLAFILLHEIAHHKLKHGPLVNDETKEKEADEWAHAELLKSYSVFSG